MEESVQPSWWEWTSFLPVGELSVAVLVLVFVCLIFALVIWAIKSSDVYKLALDKVVFNPDVVEALGLPIKEGFFIRGRIRVGGRMGSARLAIPVSGPKGKAIIYLQARKSKGGWSFSKLSVKLKASNRFINLIDVGPTTPTPQLK